jgi:hypothetical protein
MREAAQKKEQFNEQNSDCNRSIPRHWPLRSDAFGA